MPKAKRKSSGRMASKGFPNPIDVFIGDKIRQRRTTLGISQEVLADHLGLTFQQVQKYEKGANRVAASRIVDCGAALQVEPAWFFEGIPEAILNASPARLNGQVPPAAEIEEGLARYDLEMAKAFHHLSPTLRTAIMKLVRSLTGVPGGPPRKKKRKE